MNKPPTELIALKGVKLSTKYHLCEEPLCETWIQSMYPFCKSHWKALNFEMPDIEYHG